MKNPFKVYSPVRELVQDIKDFPTKYEVVTLVGNTHLWISLNGRDSQDWHFSISPIFPFAWYTSSEIKWATFAEIRYIYRELIGIARENAKPRVPDHESRAGWTEKLGIDLTIKETI